ncbi:MAG: aminotransferase class I/II-fold pyridoxal phosphate-dependent enzyme [Oscillospiraceae bacterium]|nr:aminotransferase class I/II-fold pyridoxal phosphate-dependent enzyme [Oscillospiraceae bacterium]
MQKITALTREQLAVCREELAAAYDKLAARGLALDMSRGKPGPDQLALSAELLDALLSPDDPKTVKGFDVRNYGLPEGIPEARALFGGLLDMPADQVVAGGNSSLNMMFDYVATAYAKGVCGHPAWAGQQVKFLCPVPGYDRHFSLTEFFGIGMIPVKMDENGPDMDEVERLAADPAVKGIWCVPAYSNPTGIVYSDAVVERLAALNAAAPDFRIMWDCAYIVHHLTDTPPALKNLYKAAAAYGKEDQVIMFGSTSKITFAGAGLAALAASPANIADIKKRIAMQTIGPDKVNMLRHVRFFGDADGVRAHMKLHKEILAPKFDLVCQMLEQNLGGKGIASWVCPQGGYFVSVELLPGTAARVVKLVKEAGMVMTGAGATWPYGKDPADSNLRIAPTFPPLDELKAAMELFCVAVELAAVEKLMDG